MIFLRFEVRHNDNTIGELSSGKRLVSGFTFIRSRKLHEDLVKRDREFSSFGEDFSSIQFDADVQVVYFVF